MQQCREIEHFLQKGGEVSFQGEICNKEIKHNQPVYVLEQVILHREGEEITCPSVLLYPSSDSDPIGTIYIGEASLESFDFSRNEGNFDEGLYYRSNAIFAKLVSPTVKNKILSKHRIRQSLFDIRKSMGLVYAKTLPGEEAGIMSTLVTGEKSNLEPEAKSLFQLAGLSHILVVSGLHISAVGMFVYNLLRKVGVGYGMSGLMSFSLSYFYALMCGMGNSAKRALFMFMLHLLGNFLGEAYDTAISLAFAALLMVWANPLLVENTGFLFSFLAVLGVVVIGARLGIQLMTLPLLAASFYEVPIYSVILNLILLPFVGPLLGAGLCGGLVGCKSLVGARLPLQICHLLLYGSEWLMHLFNSLPGARQIVGIPKLWQVIVYYGILYLACYQMRGKYRRLRMFVATGLALTILCWPHPTRFEIDVLDVGQGDGIYIQSEEGVRCFIDGGSSSVSQVGKYRILPFLKSRGIRRIDYWFVSHTDQDHISGLLECLEDGYSVETLVFSEWVVRDDNYELLCATAKKQGVKIYHMKPKEICKTTSLSITNLFPSEAGEDANGNSMVLLVETEGFRGLFTGDLSVEQEELLDFDTVGEVDFFKASHHGSNGSNSSVLLENIQPKYVSISCAKRNRYGHPGKEAVKRLKENNCHIYYTMTEGQIRVRKNSITTRKEEIE